MRPADVGHALARLPDLVNGDPGLVRRGRALSTTILLAADEHEYLVRVAEGRIAAVETGPFLLRGWSFAVRAPAAAWVRFWEPVLAPGYHDLFAMKKLGVARVEGDLRDRVGRIDTARCPLYLMTGEYDFSCTPDDTRATAEAVAGARLIIMKELGHFPMSEHPERFRGYLLPVLDDIRGGRP